MQSNSLLGHLMNPSSHTNYWTIFGIDYHALPGMFLVPYNVTIPYMQSFLLKMETGIGNGDTCL